MKMKNNLVQRKETEMPGLCVAAPHSVAVAKATASEAVIVAR